MNVYVRETARELGRMGVHVDVYTRSQDRDIPRVVDMGQGARVVHCPPGPRGRCHARRCTASDRFVAGVDAFRWDEALDYDLIHAHYWLSGVAGAGAARRVGDAGRPDVPHAGAAEELGGADPAEVEPELRISEETRLVESWIASSRPTSWSGIISSGTTAPSRARDGDSVWRRHRVFQPMARGTAKDLLELGSEPLLLDVGRLQPIKGLETLLQAMTRLDAETRLLIIGGDQDEPDNAHAVRLRQCVADSASTGVCTFWARNRSGASVSSTRPPR